MQLTIARNGKEFDTTVTPVLDERSGVGSAGWSEKGEVQFGPVTAGMPAQKVGLQQGDLILSAAGHPIHATVRFHEIIRGSGGKPVDHRVRSATASPCRSPCSRYGAPPMDSPAG